jgi:outer membrane receptor for ferrienterochelin and colicins
MNLLRGALVGWACLAAPEAGAAGPDAAPPSEPDESGLEGLLAEPVLSAASRTAESASDAPGTTWIISGTDLRRFGIQSVEEAIRFLGHAMVSYEYDERLNAAFGARGYLSDNLGLHLAVLIDGNQAGGSAKTARGTEQYLMPIELVDHIEVIIGPGSVIYGNSAMLGVINVVTRSLASLDGTHVVAQVSGGTPADPWARDGSWGEAWGRAAAYGGERFQLRGDPFELTWHVAARWDRQEGRAVWRQVTGVDPYTSTPLAYTREDVFNRDFHSRIFAKATWGSWTFMSWVAYAQGTGTGPIEGTGGSSYVEPEYGFDATWTRRVADRGDLSLRGYAVVFDSRAVTVPDTIDTSNCLSLLGVAQCADTLHYVNFRPFFEPVLKWDWKRDGSQVTTLGAQAFIDGSVIITGTSALGGPQNQSDPVTVAPLPNAALYAQHIWRGAFGVLNAGVRGDLGYIGSAVSPRVAYSRALGESGTVKLVFSTGFRTPTITERYLEITNFLITNPDIRPEHVYSAEIDLAERLRLQNVQLSIFFTSWQGLISTRDVTVNGVSESQFANLRNVIGAGANLGWQGKAGPLDWGLSVNYAPGRVRLPASIVQLSDQELRDDHLQRSAIDQYGTSALGWVFLPTDGMPDFYATGHASVDLGGPLPRLSAAASLSSPRFRAGYTNDPVLLDPRNLDGPQLPWSLDLRGAIEKQIHPRLLLRLVVTGRTLNTVADPPRVGPGTEPFPSGGVGAALNLVAPLSAMLEVDGRL